MNFQLSCIAFCALWWAACSDSPGTPPTTQTPDGATSASDGSTSACTAPVTHGDSCPSEGGTACGHVRICTDVGSNQITSCTCTAGHYNCGSCPSCNVRQDALGCGIGQVCDGLQLVQCDGSTVVIDATCSCARGQFLWTCDNGQNIPHCTDGGAATTIDAPSD